MNLKLAISILMIVAAVICIFAPIPTMAKFIGCVLVIVGGELADAKFGGD